MNSITARADRQATARNDDLRGKAAPDVFGLLGERTAGGGPRLTHTAALAFFFFRCRAGEAGSVAMAISEIAGGLQVDRSTVRRLVAQLEAAGLLNVERAAGPGGLNVYRVAAPLRAGADGQQVQLFAPAVDKPPPPALVELIEAWNRLGPSIIGRAVRLPPSEAIAKAWRRVERNGELREAFGDVPALIEAIRRAKFCHAKGWFRLPWLFARKNGELNITRLLEGAFNDCHSTQTSGPGRFAFDVDKYSVPGAGQW